MEIKITTQQILKALQLVSWIIFIGLCVEAGGIIFNMIYTFFVNPVNTHSFWEKADLSALYRFNSGYFLTVTTLMSIVAVLKAVMFYLIVKLFVDNKLSMSQPFNAGLQRFLFLLSYLTLCIGFFSNYGVHYSGWLAGQQIVMPDVQSLHFGGADVWIFMAVILYVIAQIFKRGIEIQQENDLTI